MKRKLLLTIAMLLCAVGTWAETDYTSRMSSSWSTSTGLNVGNFSTGKECYKGGADYANGDKVLYQSFTAPETGIYEIKFYAVASSTSGRGWTNVYGNNIAQAYAKSGANKTTLAMEVINQTGATLEADANIRTLSVEATEGDAIEYGIENIASGGNWYIIKEISAKMKTVAEIFQDQYDEAYAIWQYSTENESGARATFKTYVDALNTAMSGTLAAAQTASDDLATAQATYETKSYPIKGNGVKYDFTSKMNMAINAWTCRQGNGPAQYGFTGATETYGGTVAGEVMYQTITGLANGEYEIHFYAVANAANGGGTASDASAKKAYAYANDQALDLDVIQQNSCTPSDYERTFTLMVTDGTIKYGITNNEAAGNWYICKNVALYMTGAPDLSDYYDAIAGKLTIANGLKSSPMKATVLSALQDSIDATEGYTDIAVIGTLETMSDKLTTAINNANTSVSNYAAALAILNAASTLDAAGQAAYAANETVAAIQTAYGARTLDAVTSSQETTCAAALIAAAKVQTSDDADMTLAIVNPSFETGNFTGWTNNGMAAQNNTSFNRKDGTYYAETWQPNGTKSVSQAIAGMPAGVYSLTVDALARGVTSAKIFGENEEQTITVSETADEYTIAEFIYRGGSDLTIGFEAVGTGVSASWICVDNFRLTYLRAATQKDVLNESIRNATAARKSSNEGTGVFQIPASAGSTLASAIATAQDVYDNGSATDDDVTDAINDLADAVETYNNTTLNAPDAEKRYYIKVATSGHAKEGNALTTVLGATGVNNPTGYGINANFAPNANLSQAFIFTQVSGNTYNISIERTEGTVYLTYGSLNGSEADWKKMQIQATTDAANKGEFKIVATNTANVFNIYNTEQKDNIDCQDEGSIYTDTSIEKDKFVVAEASQASVDVEISSGKWGTRIFPFAVTTIPEGLVAYTVDNVDGTAIVKSGELASIPANTPVVLKATKDVDETLEGWGTAGAVSYTEGLLTGVYTAATIAASVDPTAEEDGVYRYVLQTQEDVQAFYKVDSDFTATANRCYLSVSQAKTGGGAAKAFFFDEATDIDEVEIADEGDDDAPAVNVAGQTVGKDYKGIVIKAGKKYLQR